jgi:hypothetical protein
VIQSIQGPGIKTARSRRLRVHGVDGGRSGVFPVATDAAANRNCADRDGLPVRSSPPRMALAAAWRHTGRSGVPDHFAELTAPPQPPPVVAAVRCGEESDVSAVVSGHQLTPEVPDLRSLVMLVIAPSHRHSAPNDVPLTRTEGPALSADIHT